MVFYVFFDKRDSVGTLGLQSIQLGSLKSYGDGISNSKLPSQMSPGA